MKNPDAIICADIHWRDDTPECRTDNFWKAQKKALIFLRELQREYGCPVLVAGDMFHHWKPSPELLALVLKYAPKMITIAGQHDLPQHNYDLIHKSGMQVLQNAKKIEVVGDGVCWANHDLTVHGFPYGSDLDPILRRKTQFKQIALCHVLTYKKKEPFPGCEADNATKLLKKMKGFDLVVTGDNHQPFTVEHEGRLLVNPGSLMRQRSDQYDHKPRVYLWDAKANKVEAVYLPIKKEAVTKDHRDLMKDREGRITSFVSRLNESFEVGLSFPDNIGKYFQKNKTKKSVKRLVLEAME